MYCILDGQTYKFHNSVVSSVAINVEPNYIDLPTFNDWEENEILVDSDLTTIDLKIRAGQCEVIAEKDVILDFFRSVSIRDLFKEINRKIESTR